MSYKIDTEIVVFLRIKQSNGISTINEVMDFCRTIRKVIIKKKLYEDLTIDVDYNSIKNYINSSHEFIITAKQFKSKRDKKYIDFFVDQTVPGKLIEIMRDEALQ